MESSVVRFAEPRSPDSLWAEAGHDASPYGASLDRLFGEPDGGHLLAHFDSGLDVVLTADDPLVLLANFVDGVSLPTAEPMALPLPELAAVYDFHGGADGLHLHDVWMLDAHA